MSDKPSFLEKMHGKRFGDINLPSEGEVDPRLKGKSFREALESIRPSIAALKKFSDRQKKQTD
jgi:hypothetical protein